MHVGLGAVGETGVELVEDAVFAAHVVGRLGLVTERRTPQDELLLRVLDQVGQIGRTAGKLADSGFAAQAGDVSLEIGIDDGGVEFFACADAGGLVGERHAYPFCL